MNMATLRDNSKTQKQISGSPVYLGDKYLGDMPDVTQTQWNSNNPYADVDPTSQLSWWQKVGDWFGGNAAGKLRYENELAARQWESQYNLAQQQASLDAQSQRAAGVNPDLNGVSAGNAADATSGVAPDNSGSQSGRESFARFAQAIGSMVTSAIGIASGITQITGARLTQDMEAISQFLPGAVDRQASSLASVLTGAGGANDKDRVQALKDLFETGRIDMEQFDFDMISRSVPRPRTRRGRQALDYMIRQALGSSEFSRKVMQNISETNKAATDAVRSYTDNLAVSQDDDVVNVLADISTTLLNAERNELRGREEYSRTYDYGQAARSVNAGNYEQERFNRSKSTMNNVMREMIEKLDQDAHDKELSGFARVFASSMLVLISTQVVGSGFTMTPSFKPSFNFTNSFSESFSEGATIHSYH